MLRPDPRIERVYLHRAPVDMRRQIDTTHQGNRRHRHAALPAGANSFGLKC
jgi:hypothetical protein